MKELSENFLELEAEIISIIEKGNELNSKKKHEEAISLYKKAWGILPEPKLGWEMISSWLAGSFFTAYFYLEEYDLAKHWAIKQLDSDDADSNTAPLIALGMVCFELNELKEAFGYFDSAYIYGKERAFKGRPEKYFKFYLSENNK